MVFSRAEMPSAALGQPAQSIHWKLLKVTVYWRVRFYQYEDLHHAIRFPKDLFTILYLVVKRQLENEPI